MPRLSIGVPSVPFFLVLAAASGCVEDPMPAEQEVSGYAIATTQFLPDGRITALTFIDDPADPAELDLDAAIEIGGSAAIFGRDGTAAFSVGGSESPVLTRYEVTADGQLIESEDRLSFANTGITSGFKRAGLVPFISDQKAYWLDDVTLQGVVWNPTAMTIDGSISLESAVREGTVFELNERAILRDDGLLFVGADHRTDDDGELGIAVVLVIDTTTDQLVKVLEDERCGNAEHLVMDSSGTLYAGTGALGAVLYALDRPAGYPAPCLLRILPGTTTFDAGFHLAIPDLIGGRAGGRLVAGPAGRAYLLAFHDEMIDFELTETTEIWEPWEATAWQWWEIELGSDAPATKVEGAPIASAAGHVLQAGGRDFITHVNFDDLSTTLLVPAADGSLQPGLHAPGLPYGLVKIR